MYRDTLRADLNACATRSRRISLSGASSAAPWRSGRRCTERSQTCEAPPWPSASLRCRVRRPRFQRARSQQRVSPTCCVLLECRLTATRVCGLLRAGCALPTGGRGAFGPVRGAQTVVVHPGDLVRDACASRTALDADTNQRKQRGSSHVPAGNLPHLDRSPPRTAAIRGLQSEINWQSRCATSGKRCHDQHHGLTTRAGVSKLKGGSS